MNQKTNNTGVESVAKVLIINSLNKVLVLTLGEHKLHPDRSFTHDLPGGIVEDNETELDTAIRETKEESGIILTAGELLLAYTGTEYHPSEKKSVSKFLYLAQINNSPEVTLSWEHSSYEWIPINKLLELIKFRPFFEEAIKYSINCGLLHSS